MASATYGSQPRAAMRGDTREALHDPAYQAFMLLRIGFTVAPILFGIDKFFNFMVQWQQYLAPWLASRLPVEPEGFMYLVGAIEILAGIIVALKPRYGAYIVAAWLAGIIVNLLTFSGWYDIALRDFGLMLGALTLGRLASIYDVGGLPLFNRR